jgi:hypothetical protein
LSLIGTPEAQDIIFDLANTGDERQQIYAVESMANIKNDSSRSLLETIAADKKRKDEIQIAAIKVLGELGNEETPKKLNKLYINSKGKVAVKLAIIQANSKLEKRPEEEILDEMRVKIWQKEFKRLQKIKNRIPLWQKSKLTLKDRIIKNIGSTKAAIKIDRAIKKMGKSKSAPNNLVYKSYLPLYPNSSFDEIRQKMSRGLSNSRAFRKILRNLMTEYPNDGLRILALQNMLKINKTEATKLYTAFKQGKI